MIIRKLPDDGVPYKGKKIEYDVEKLVYRQAAWVDPVSGRRTAGTEFIDDIERTCEFFGRQRPYQKSNDESKE